MEKLSFNNRTGQFWLLIMNAVLVCISMMPDLSFAVVQNTSSVIVAKASGKCMDVGNASMLEGAAIIQWSCHSWDSQQWVLKSYADSYQNVAYQVIDKLSGKCLEVREASQAVGAELQQATCTIIDNQLWNLELKGDYFQLVVKHSGQCLSINNGWEVNGQSIVQMPCGGTDNQLWNVAALSHSPIAVKHSNKCLGITATGGVTVFQKNCDGSASQQWILKPYLDAYQVIVQQTGQCLDVAGSSQEEGGQVHQWTCWGGSNQLWYVEASNGSYQLVAKHSAKCLSVNNAALTDGEIITQLSCQGAANQLWQVGPASAKAGKWTAAVTLPLVPVAAANLPDGTLLLWSSKDKNSFQGEGGLPNMTYTTIFNPLTNEVAERLVYETGHDMFCPGTANLPNGHILVNGGSTAPNTSIYDPFTQVWNIGAPMNIARAYEGNTVLSSGDVFTIGGSWNGGVGFKDGEVWNAASGWRHLSSVSGDAIVTDDPAGGFRADNHPWLFGVGNRRVFHAGPSKQMNWFETDNTGSSASAGNRGDDDHSMNGNAVLYDKGKILKIGGAPAYNNAYATPNAYVININNGVNVRKTASLAYGRIFSTSVVLPNGEVVVTGGQAYSEPFTDQQSVLATELWNPLSETFTTLAPMSIPRNYHSVALLMPDGRVFVGGGGLCGACSTNHADAQIFTPPYLLKQNGDDAIRPVITAAPLSAGYGESMTINTNAAVNRFALLRLASVTHTVNNDQRRVPLSFTRVATTAYKVNIPFDRGTVIPGYYMLFALNSAGVPSIAKIIKIG